MQWNEFYQKAVPEEIRLREAGKNPFVTWSRWFSSREAYLLYHLGITGNMVSLFRVVLALVSLFLFSRFRVGDLPAATLGVVLMAWQLNLDGVDGALARARGEASDFGTAIDNLGIDYSRAAFWILVAAMTEHTSLILVSFLAAHLLVTFKQYVGVASSGKVDRFVRRFIYVPVLLVMLPLTMISLAAVGLPERGICLAVTLFYIFLAAFWFMTCLWQNLVACERVR